jgi:hypothetical protein
MFRPYCYRFSLTSEVVRLSVAIISSNCAAYNSTKFKPTPETMDVKTGSSDSADFAMTRHQIHWRVLAIRAMLGATVGISRLSQSDMPTD